MKNYSDRQMIYWIILKHIISLEVIRLKKSIFVVYKKLTPQIMFRASLAFMTLGIYVTGVNANEKLTLSQASAFYKDKALFIAAIHKESITPNSKIRVSGITVPHHLVAPDFIARGFWAASSGHYDRIIILFPDHFRLLKKPFATTLLNFNTVLGPTKTDVPAVHALAKRESDFIEINNGLATDHGLRAILPFVSHFFPAVPILPVAASSSAYRVDWDRATAALKHFVTRRTLIIQSTDFSHYLPSGVAQLRDQETINVLSAGSLDQMARLRQPEHMDSKASQYIQLRLQSELYGAKPIIIGHRNSQSYTTREVKETTSYIVQIYRSDRILGPAWPHVYPNQKMVYFAGDTLLGRNWIPILRDSKRVNWIVQEVIKRTGGHDLIVNLEGSILPEVPHGLLKNSHAMPEGLATHLLRRLNVVAVSLANNHANDLGLLAIAKTKSALSEAGIKALQDGTTLNFKHFRLSALTDIDNRAMPVRPRITLRNLHNLSRRSMPVSPTFLFVHWGTEFSDAPDLREQELAYWFRKNGIATVIGAHSHQASKTLRAEAGGEMIMAYSLGNFLFDQASEKASGAFLEVRFLEGGTHAARIVPHPNFYRIVRASLPTTE